MEHLHLLQANFRRYFPEEEHVRITQKEWIINPFAGNIDLERLEDLRADIIQKVAFKSFQSYSDFWVSLVKIPEYKSIAAEAIAE